ncbi:PIN domain-containing protein [Candidatus Aerophobetes bacterium]|nr:PIN domain-containing protein [Candidatus Aerophobetes bacterium]
MIVAVDTNILVDILNKDERYFESSRKLLGKALSRGGLVINEIVYAELAGLFERKGELDKFLDDFGITLSPSNGQALWEAGKAWNIYTAKRNKQIQCTGCGEKFTLRCKSCSNIIVSRQHIISDFLIGGHARVLADSLLTRDRGYYRTYFKEPPLFL